MKPSVETLISIGGRVISVRAWRMWVMGVLARILGGHRGKWGLHELFFDGVDVHEVSVIIAGVGALLSSIPDKE